MLQMSVQKYRRFREEFDPEANGKEQDNALLFISHLFTFKVQWKCVFYLNAFPPCI